MLIALILYRAAMAVFGFNRMVLATGLCRERSICRAPEAEFTYIADEHEFIVPAVEVVLCCEYYFRS